MKTEFIKTQPLKPEPRLGDYFVWEAFSPEVRQIVRIRDMYGALDIATGEAYNVSSTAKAVFDAYKDENATLVEPVGFVDGKLQFQVKGSAL